MPRINRVDVPDNYLDLINIPQEEIGLESLRQCVNKSKPYGAAGWIEKIINKFNLKSTQRNPGRPKKGS